MEKKEKPTIGMLLDIEHLYGEHGSRLGPVLLSLLLGGTPILIYVYFELFLVIPIWIFIPIEIIVIIRVIMIIPGREHHRKEIFKRQLYDEYTSTANLMNIKTIHADGCIEYINGKIMYLVVCLNGTCTDELYHSIEIKKLLNNLLGDYVFDIYIHNITISPELRAYYDRVANFEKNESARNFIKIIDYNIALTENASMVQCTIYAVKGKRSDWKDISNALNLAVKSRASKCYKSIYVVRSPDEINEIINRDIDTTISMGDMLRSKYKTGDYDSSKVLAYDLPEGEEIVQGQSAVKPIIPSYTKKSFHIPYNNKEVTKNEKASRTSERPS